MHAVAHEAGYIDPGSLQDRGYKVRIGHGDADDNTERSNSWNSDRHIPIHSNAHGGSIGECGASNGGTITFHYPGSTNGEDLARKLKNKVGTEGSGASPGTTYEYVDARSDLIELYGTTMPAAYLEAEFHTWTTGKNWLIDYDSWGWRIGWAVDTHLGYP